MSPPPLVVVTDSDLPLNGLAGMLKDAGLEVRFANCRTEGDVVAAVRGATALIVQWAPVTARVLDAAPRCRFISRLGVGYDMIDIDAATERGVFVANTPDYCIQEVALHTVALAFAGLRSVAELDRFVRAGSWNAVDAPRAVRPSETIAAVVGFGRVGSAVARTLAAAEFRVLVHDPYVEDDLIIDAGHEPVAIDDALERALLLTLHTPLTGETRHLLHRRRIALLPPGAYVVNTSRGGLVDQEALADALIDGHLSGAALDVFDVEPLPSDSRLRTAPNVLLSPHAAWYSPTALAELPRHAAANVTAFIADRPVPSLVNPGPWPDPLH